MEAAVAYFEVHNLWLYPRDREIRAKLVIPENGISPEVHTLQKY
jgi:hypothetical protein